MEPKQRTLLSLGPRDIIANNPQGNEQFWATVVNNNYPDAIYPPGMSSYQFLNYFLRPKSITVTTTNKTHYLNITGDSTIDDIQILLRGFLDFGPPLILPATLVTLKIADHDRTVFLHHLPLRTPLVCIPVQTFFGVSASGSVFDSIQSISL